MIHLNARDVTHPIQVRLTKSQYDGIISRIEGPWDHKANHIRRAIDAYLEKVKPTNDPNQMTTADMLDLPPLKKKRRPSQTPKLRRGKKVKK